MPGGRGRARRPGLSSNNILPEGEKRERRPRREQDYQFDDDDYNEEEFDEEMNNIEQMNPYHDYFEHAYDKKDMTNKNESGTINVLHGKGLSGKSYMGKGPSNVAGALLPPSFSYPPPFLVIGGPPPSCLRTFDKKTLKRRLLEQWDPTYKLYKLREEQERIVENARKNHYQQEERARFLEARQLADFEEKKTLFEQQLSPQQSTKGDKQPNASKLSDFNIPGVTISEIPARSFRDRTPPVSYHYSDPDTIPFSEMKSDKSKDGEGGVAPQLLGERIPLQNGTCEYAAVGPILRREDRRLALQYRNSGRMNGSIGNDNGSGAQRLYRDSEDLLLAENSLLRKRKAVEFSIPLRPKKRRFPRLLRFDGNIPIPTPPAALQRKGGEPKAQQESGKPPTHKSAKPAQSGSRAPDSSSALTGTRPTPLGLFESRQGETNLENEQPDGDSEWGYHRIKDFEIHQIRLIATSKYDVRMNSRGKTKLQEWLQWIQMVDDTMKKFALRISCTALELDPDILSKDEEKRKAAILNMNNERLRLLEGLMIRCTSRDGSANWSQLYEKHGQNP